MQRSFCMQEGFKKRLVEELEVNTRKCQEHAAREAAIVAQRHAEEIQRHQIRSVSPQHLQI